MAHVMGWRDRFGSVGMNSSSPSASARLLLGCGAAWEFRLAVEELNISYCYTGNLLLSMCPYHLKLGSSTATHLQPPCQKL